MKISQITKVQTKGGELTANYNFKNKLLHFYLFICVCVCLCVCVCSGCSATCGSVQARDGTSCCREKPGP